MVTGGSHSSVAQMAQFSTQRVASGSVHGKLATRPPGRRRSFL